MHETFLTRLAAHPVFRHDHNFRVFLEYDQDVSLGMGGWEDCWESEIRMRNQNRSSVHADVPFNRY